MIINRVWAMPNNSTFSIKPIKMLIKEKFELLNKTLKGDVFAVDPFVGNSPFRHRCYSNDIDPAIKCGCNIDALDFLKSIESNEADIVLFDPPYSPGQVSEVYKKLSKSVNMQTTQSSFWGNIKKEIARITRKNGMVISFGWNSGGIGKRLGFKIIEILLVPHGGWHNDTIVTVEIKVK